MTQAEVMKLLARAAKTNLERDAMERASGLATPHDGGAAVLMRTVIDALHCGLSMEDWNCVGEAIDMLAKQTNYYPWLDGEIKLKVRQ